MAANRFNGTIALADFGLSPDQVQATASMIFGQGGGNIRRMTTQVPGTHIRLFNRKIGPDGRCSVRECDAVQISGRSQEDVRKIAQMIKTDVQALQDPAKNTTRPTVMVDCPKEAVGSVIGRGGTKLKDIQRESGGTCFIRHDREVQKFVVTADDHESLETAHTLNERAIQKYNDTKYKWETPNPTDSDEEMESIRPNRQESVQERAQRELLEAMFKSGPVKQGLSERERWAIREKLAESKNPDGSKRYEPYWGYDQRGKSQYFDGIHAVPWSEVDKEIQRLEEESYTLEQNLKAQRVVQKNEEDRQSWEADWDISEDTVSTSSWDAIEGHSEKLKRVKDGSGVGELQETQDKENEVREHKREMVVLTSRRRPKKTQAVPAPRPGNTQVDLSDLLK